MDLYDYLGRDRRDPLAIDRSRERCDVPPFTGRRPAPGLGGRDHGAASPIGLASF